MRRAILLVVSALLTAVCNLSPHALAPLVAAARSGDVAAIRVSVARGADPNGRDGVNAWTPLLHAVHRNQPASVVALLDAGADPNGTDPHGTTPLMMASGYGYTPIVKALLARGADPRAAAADGVTAIDLARAGVPDVDRFTVFRCQTDTVRALLAADPKLPDHRGRLPLPARIVMRLKNCA